MHYLSGCPRNQLQLFTSLEDSISDDNPVRLIDALVDLFYSHDPLRFSYKGECSKGRKAYSPSVFLKLYLYGYLNRINSSRRLETETYRNIEVKWLLCDLHPDFKTIADYRKDNKDAIRYVTISFRRFLKEEGFISGNKITYDGTKVKACNSKEKVITNKQIFSRLSKLEAQLEDYLCQLDSNDHNEDTEQEADHFGVGADINKDLLEEVCKLRGEIEELRNKQESIRAGGYNSYCSTDPDAHLMKSRDGFIPGHNVQIGTDSKHKMIVMAEVIPEINDVQALEANIENTREQLDIVPDIVLADKGYSNIAQIESI